MKKSKQLLSVLLVMLMIIFTACTQQPAETDAPGETETPENETKAEDVIVDMVVVGGGMAGLSTSIEAARLGANVILLEKLSFVGGSSALCEGYIWSSDAKFNEKTGQGFDAQTMTDYLNDNHLGQGNSELVRNIVNVSGKVLDTYLEEGLRLNTDEFTYGGVYNENLLMPFTAPQDGAGMIIDMKKIAEQKGVDIRVSSPATDILTGDNGEVIGVTVKDEDGTYNIYADTVVLTTGGFANNDELMKEYLPTFADNRILQGTVGATGDGHKMALKLGGSIIGESMLGTYALDEMPTYEMPIGGAIYSARFVVNKEGLRFCKEFGNDADGDDYFFAVSKQTGNQAFALFDSNSAMADVLDESSTEGLAAKADTLEELAKAAGINYEALAKEVEAYTSDSINGIDDSKWGLPNEEMAPLIEGPFYLVEMNPWSCMGVMAGVKVNKNCQVLGENDEPIENLYGAGELIMGNIVYDRYPTCGTALAAGMYGGVIAANHALGK